MKPFLEPVLAWLRFQKIKRYIPKEGRICDIGCGQNAALLFKLKDFIGQGVGYDKRVEALETGKILLKKTEIFDHIGEKSNSFDCVTLLAALEHFDRPREILKECFRILCPGGCLLITVPTSRAKSILEFLSYKMGIVSRQEISDHKFYFDDELMTEVLAGAGFKPDKIIFKKFELGCNFFVRAVK